MTTLVSTNTRDPWLRRLTLPAYQVIDAARYVAVTTQTVRNWQHANRDGYSAIAARRARASLSYYQLQELSIVAAMRLRGVSLKKIRLARDWLSSKFNLEFPFSDERVKTDGQDVLMEEFETELGKNTARLMVASRGGQYVWADIIGHRFGEFDYERHLAIRWNIHGRDSGVVIDPRISFGAPAVRGVPTWAIRGRRKAGETIEDIAEDFKIDKDDVMKALRFEGASIH
jgi:uncharacterized protein (DUF433 family)